MALDAHVCCDCFGRGQLRSPPPPGCNPSVCADGSLWCGSDDLDVLFAFDRWRQLEACGHEDGYLVAHRSGNIALVASLRRELGRWPERFPVILSRVIYDGIHCGDFIQAADVPQLPSGRCFRSETAVHPQLTLPSSASHQGLPAGDPAEAPALGRWRRRPRAHACARAGAFPATPGSAFRHRC